MTLVDHGGPGAGRGDKRRDDRREDRRDDKRDRRNDREEKPARKQPVEMPKYEHPAPPVSVFISLRGKIQHLFPTDD